MTVLLIDNKSAHLERLRKLIIDKLRSVNFVQRDPRAVTEGEVHAADLIVISGGVGRSIVKNPRTFSRIVRLAASARKPTIGICLGAEAMAVEYGGVLQEMPVRRVGNIPILLDEKFKAQLAFRQDDKVMVYEFHKWLINKTFLPSPLRILATSKDGVEVLKHESLPMWGLQFHPEVLRLNNAGQRIFDYILRDLGLKEDAS